MCVHLKCQFMREPLAKKFELVLNQDFLYNHKMISILFFFVVFSVIGQNVRACGPQKNTETEINVNLASKTICVDPANAELWEDFYIKDKDEYYPINRNGSKNIKRALCYKKSLNLRKCCGLNEMINPSNKNCVKRSYLKNSEFRPLTNNNVPLSFKTNARTNCPSGQETKIYYHMDSLYHSEETNLFQLTPNGVCYQTTDGLFLKRKIWTHVASHDNYCVDRILGKNGEQNNSMCESTQNCSNLTYILVLCRPINETKQTLHNADLKYYYMLAALWLSTCPLLFTGSVINVCIIQKNVHGVTLSCYLLSMCIVNLLSVFLLFRETPNEGCQVVDFSIKFIYLSSICWLTSINLGLWKTFRKLYHPEHSKKREFLYSLLFSFSLPGFVVTISYFVGKDNGSMCALYSLRTIPIYSSTIILLTIVNFTFFLRTACTIYSCNHEIKATLQNRRSKEGLESFMLFTRLFLMTGSFWILRLALLYLQVRGQYFTWYGVCLEAVFSLPEAIFPLMLFMRREVITWTWKNFPTLAVWLKRLIPWFQESNPQCQVDTAGFPSGGRRTIVTRLTSSNKSAEAQV